MRVVLGTNIFASSFFGGKPRQIVDLWKSGRITLCLSSGILDEYLAVLARMGVDEGPELRDLLRLFRESRHMLFASHPRALRIVEDDPDDDKFVACAIALNVPFLVSGDRHLTRIGRYMDIRIVSPAEFLASWRAEV